jgi:hypothetical protein
MPIRVLRHADVQCIGNFNEFLDACAFMVWRTKSVSAVSMFHALSSSAHGAAPDISTNNQAGYNF